MYDLEGLLAIYKCSLVIDIITVDIELPVIDNVTMDTKSMITKIFSAKYNMKHEYETKWTFWFE